METHPCTQYVLDVMDGRRVVGETERLACARHLKDLERQGTPDFPYIFDEERAYRIYRWFLACHHLEGPKAGLPIELEPFQKFDLGCIFGWVHMETGYRRFEKAFIEEARKNGKSTEMSGIGLYLMAGDREENPAVYCAAVDREQANIIYQASKMMGMKSPDIRKRLKIRNYQISHITRGGWMKALSKETKNKDGLNPHGAIIDEYHAHPTSEIYDLLWSAFGQRTQALFVIITTAGLETENNPCYGEYTYCKSILAGNIQNERYFVMIRELDKDDDEHDSANWIKANPLRAATPEGLEKLKAQHDEAFDSKDLAKIRTFRVKILNKWVNEKEDGYMTGYMERWNELAVSREEFYKLTRGRSCIVGCDLSKKIDLTACGFLFALDEERIAVSAHGFIPEEAIARHERTDHVLYRDWAKDGWVTATLGDVTDYRAIKTFIYDAELEWDWKIYEFCFDPYNATHFANEMSDDGYKCVEIRQGMKTLSEPTKLFREKVANRKVIHDGSPVLKWCLANAVFEMDHNENIKLSKKNAGDTKRIDLAASIMNGMVRYPALKDAEEYMRNLRKENSHF